MIALAASLLFDEEKMILPPTPAKAKLSDSDPGTKGELLLSDMRLAFVVREGIINPKYSFHHWVYIPFIMKLRTERRFFSTCLVVEWYKKKGTHTGCHIYRYEGLAQPDLWMENIKKVMAEKNRSEATFDEIAEHVNSQERTTFAEINDIIAKHYNGEQSPPEHIRTWLQSLLRKKRIEGFIDMNNLEFVHMTAYKQKKEVIQYNVAASFNFSSSGTLEIKCPHCSGSQELTEKHRMVTCEYCGKNYIIPKKILSLL